VTRLAIATALGKTLLLNQTVVQRYEQLRGEPLNEKQLEMCRLPEGAEPVYAGSSGAPGFRVENICVLPGVPAILREMWETISHEYAGEPLHVETFVTNSRESEFAGVMEEYQEAYPELKFGSYPRMTDSGWEVRIRVRGQSLELVQEAAASFQQDIGGTPGTEAL
jgi:molybdopterin-biosynthesis enzyme MoeA-like protein